MTSKLRRTLLALVLALALTSPAHAREIPIARALMHDASAAALTVVVFTRADCRYCTLVKRDYLQALAQDARYRGQLIVREIRQDADWPLTDFSGKASTHQRFALDHGISLVPVVAFFDRQGKSLAEPIVGARLNDFYQSYLDEAVRTSLASLRATAR